ncbi:hypothetical protein JCM8547_001656 [Rhodosporidiobolus lusitaniae]
MRKAASAAVRCAALRHARTGAVLPSAVVAAVASSSSSLNLPTALPSFLRSFSSTPSPSFFFRKPTKTLAELAQDLLTAKDTDRPDLLAKRYKAYVDALPSSLSSSSSSFSSSSSSGRGPLTHPELRALMRFAGRTKRLALAQRIFADLSSLFHFPLQSGDHHNLVFSLCRSDKLLEAEEWLESMESAYGVKPHWSDWNLVLNGYRKRGDLSGIRETVQRMREQGVVLSVGSYNVVLAALFEQGKVGEARKLVGEMRERGVEGDLRTETTLLSGFEEAGERDLARETRDRVVRRVEASFKRAKGKASSSSPRAVEREEEAEEVREEEDDLELDTAGVNALLKFEARDRGYAAACELAEKYRDAGVPLSERTLVTLLQAGAETVTTAEEGVQAIEELEDLVAGGKSGRRRVEADRRAWSIVLKALVKASAGDAEEALRLYDLARDRGVKPDSGMVQPLLDALLSSPSRASTSSSSTSDDPLSTAKSLYEDLTTSSSSSSSSLPDASIFTTLLRACSSPSLGPDLSFSRTLINDMKRLGVSLDGPSTSWHIIALMRTARTWEDAFSSYDTIRALDPRMLGDAAGYNTVLKAFVELAPRDSPDPYAAPAAFVQEFLTDMRTSRHPPNSTTYSLLLHHYSRSPSSLSSSVGAQTIAHLHSLLKLDVHLDPDVGVFNSLMDAYSHVGAYGAAYRVWDSMLANLTRGGGVRPNETTLSILIDTCGFDASPGAKEAGRRVWRDLEEQRGWAREEVLGWRRNRKNWDSWVEALARWGEWNEVERVVFEEMKGEEEKGGKGAPRATRETVETVLRMAKGRAGRKVLERLRERTERERPEVWVEVKGLEFLRGTGGGGKEA